VSGYFSAAPRPLTPADAEPARGLVLATLGITPYVDRVMELLAEAERGDVDTHALTIERDGTCAALALFGGISPSHGVWKLHTLLLAERVVAREVGGTLLGALAERVRPLGARSLLGELPADPVYGRTLTLLRANGFRQEGRVPDFFRDGVALLFLRRSL
jgi:L-amino acid N-acyltransferase YncA